MGHVIVNITLFVGSLILSHCRNRCVMEDRCKSINVRPAVKDAILCQLSDSDHKQHPKDLRRVAGSVYTGTEVGICIFFVGAFRCSEGRTFVYCLGKRGGGWEVLGAEDFGGSRNYQGE